MYVCTCAVADVYIYICISTYMLGENDICVCLCSYVHAYMCAYEIGCVCCAACVYMYVCMTMNACTYVRTYVYIFEFTYNMRSLTTVCLDYYGACTHS
jgi:hypothetical protein